MAEGKRIVQLQAAASTAKEGVFAIVDPITDQTVQIAVQAALGATRASFAWQVGDTYDTDDIVLFNGLTTWTSLVDSNIGNVPAENSFWTAEPISVADGITDTEWAAGLFTYEKSKVIYLNAQYYLQVSAPYLSSNIGDEITAGDWDGPAPTIQDSVLFNPQSPDPAHQEGQVFYSDDQKAFSAHNDIPGVTLNMGREQWKRGINKTGGQLTDGSIVKSGPVDVASDRPTVLLVGAGDVDIHDTLGFLTHDVDDDAECEITTSGDVQGLDTISGGFSEGVLYMSATPGEWSNTPPPLPNAVVNMGRFEKIHASEGRIFARIIPPRIPSEKSFSPSFTSYATGLSYVTGGYLFGASNFTPSGTPQPLGTANIAHGMHAFIVLGASSTDMVVRITGTSYVDEDGVRTTGDTVDIDTSGGSLNDYYETEKKWIGQINYTLLSGTGIAVNYGFAKYWDNKNTPFIITQIEWDGEAGFNDSSPNAFFFHHSENDWTYNAGSTPTPAAAISDMQSSYVTEYQFENGLKFNYKKTGLSELIMGDTNEGLIIQTNVSNSNSVSSSNFDIKYID